LSIRRLIDNLAMPLPLHGDSGDLSKPENANTSGSEADIPWVKRLS